MSHRLFDAPLQALVFDFDGTLATLTLDFGEIRSRVVALAAGYLPQPPQADGQPVLEWVESLAQEIERGVKGSAGRRNGAGAARQFQTRCAKMIQTMEVAAAAHGRLFPFTRLLLRELAKSGLGLAIITRNCRPALRAVFPDVAQYCDFLLTREDVTRVKPDPSHLLAALERLGCSPTRALMVGDHPLDIETGRRAGTLTAAVASGANNRAVLQAHGPDFLADDVSELMRELRAKGLAPRPS